MFGKLFSTMYDGTLGTRGPWEALVTFQQLIILADREGVVDMTPEALARRTTVPLEIITKGLATLEQPDPDSRTPDEDGRRIVPLSDSRAWGWRIVNYGKYRAIRTADERRDYMRQYQRDRRAKAAVNTVNPVSTKLANSSKQRQEASKPPPAKKAGGAGARGGMSARQAPTPVSVCFQTYQAGVKVKYGATYPPSAKANGQLSQVVARVGAEAAPAVIEFYLAIADPWYVKMKHSLDLLVRDCEKLFIDLQQARGARAGPAPTKAEAFFELQDGQLVQMAEYPIGPHLDIARTFAREYARRIARGNVRNILVKIGPERRRFTMEELTQ